MNKEPKNNQEKRSQFNYLRIANIALVMLIFICGASYLVGMNDLSIKHFVIQENKRKVRLLKDQNTELETQIMALSSYNTINKKVASLKMVKVDQVSYISASALVAKR